MRTLAFTWLVCISFACGWLLHLQSTEHAHATTSHAAAIAANDNAMTVSRWQATLAADVHSSIGDADDEMRRLVAGLCEGLYALARTVPNRTDVPAAARRACPGLPEETAGAHERLDPVAYRRRR